MSQPQDRSQDLSEEKLLSSKKEASDLPCLEGLEGGFSSFIDSTMQSYRKLKQEMNGLEKSITSAKKAFYAFRENTESLNQFSSSTKKNMARDHLSFVNSCQRKIEQKGKALAKNKKFIKEDGPKQLLEAAKEIDDDLEIFEAAPEINFSPSELPLGTSLPDSEQAKQTDWSGFSDLVKQKRIVLGGSQVGQEEKYKVPKKLIKFQGEYVRYFEAKKTKKLVQITIAPGLEYLASGFKICHKRAQVRSVFVKTYILKDGSYSFWVQFFPAREGNQVGTAKLGELHGSKQYCLQEHEELAKIELDKQNLSIEVVAIR